MHRTRLPSGILPFVVTLALLASLPGTASAQRREWRRDDNLRLNAYFLMAFAGEADTAADSNIAGVGASADLDPTFGFGFRVESAILPFLSLGGLFEAAAFRADLPAPLSAERKWVFDFDFLPRLRWMIEVVRRDFYLEPYFAVPFGFSLGVLPDIDTVNSDDDEAWPGWNIGTMAGLSFISGMGLGGFFELGWRHHHMHSSGTFPVVGDVDVRIATDQFALNLGVLYVF